jgi:elongation factor P--(R)-beta-lysine ligase
LRTSPEYPLKRLLAAGVGDCYEIGRVFRNGEAGGRHNPEFTLLEWYRVGWDHRRLMAEVGELIAGALALAGRAVATRTLTYQALFLELAGLDPHACDEAALRAALAAFRIRGDGLVRDDWLDLVLTHCIEPRLPADTLLLVHDFPASQAALARIRPGAIPLAQRFEAVLGGVELANGYHELAAADEQGARFEADLARRRTRGAIEPPLDQHLLDALGHGLPDCAGVALGIDRLLMAMLGTRRIADVLAFDFRRA